MEIDASVLVTSISIGGAIFVGFVLMWFLSGYLRKRLRPDSGRSDADLPLPNRSWEEKRSQPRLAVSWRASFPSGDGTVSAQLKDVSLGGAFVVCPQPLGLSERLRLTIELPDRGPLELSAEVVWSNANVPADRVVNRGMGIRFVDNEEARRRVLAEAIATLLQTLPPQPTPV